ncbi:MAG: response regulator [Bacteroidales bacterium]|nr:response regulator [Bacteroidales bacterium]
MIVDDIPRNIQILGNILREFNYEIEFATNGKDALDWLNTKNFHLVLLDIMMPGMDGYEVCRKIKEKDIHKNISVIFITAKTETDSMLKGFEVGAVDYITKPFNKNELIARIQTHLTLIEQKYQLEQSNAFKNKLFSVIGHDLRDPIGSLKNYAEFFLQSKNKEDLDPEIASFLKGDFIDIGKCI